MLNRLFHPYSRYCIYTLVILFLALNRSKLDNQIPFVSSDSEIKYYQTVMFAEKGIRAIQESECHYPGKIYDPEFKYFPFDYPWAFLKENKNRKCLFQYPPLFALLNGLLSYLLGTKIITLLPLLCLFGCFLFFDKILFLFIDKAWIVLISTLIPFVLSFPVLSSVEFSEVPLNNLLLLSFGYFLIRSLFSNKIKIEIKDSNFRIFSFVSGILATTSFFLRTESVFPVFLFGLLSLFSETTRKKLKEYLIFSGIGAIVSFGLIGYLNFIYSGHPMGIRFLISSGDAMNQFSFGKQILIFQGYLLGDETKSGFLKASPYTILVLGIFSNLIRKRTLSGETIFGLVGIGTIFGISFLSPYTVGVHHFGLRYLESGFIFLSAGIFIFLYQRNIEFPNAGKVLVLLALFSLYYNYKFTREGFKILFGAIKPYTEIQNEFQSRKIIVHKGQFTNYLIGYSYLNSIHFAVVTEKDSIQLEETFKKNQIQSYSILEYDLEPPRDPNLPEKQFKEKIAVRFPDPSYFYKQKDSKKILNFTLKTYQLSNH
ncbi:LA_3751/LA_3752 family putative glycosyltransferase [Leptospira interrogans]|uniref:LA_3751/LA_3752 family putative glycosyltransferase n=1 Tax=Leptospira interrogans TaxID=173 RepID=UPI003F9FC227